MNERDLPRLKPKRVRRPPSPEWLRWLKNVSKGGTPAGQLPSLGLLTGQDMRALGAVAACWQLAAGDDRALQSALHAVAALLLAMQPEARPFARELIAWALDWGYRDRYWPAVCDLSASLKRQEDDFESWIRDQVELRAQADARGQGDY